MSASRPWGLALGLLVAGGCSAMGLFSDPPDSGETPCSEGVTRDRPTPCGLCGRGTFAEVCRDGRWVADGATPCTDPDDRDGDGLANDACAGRAGGCCVTTFDCNDHDASVGTGGACTWRPGGADGVPDRQDCATSCGTTGTQTCTATCAWASCQPPADGCDGIDNDCDGATDEDAACRPGAVVACRTTCDLAGAATGSGPCGADCTVPTGTGCSPPIETCNGRDDDCDTTADNGFACVQGTAVDCVSRCGSTGTGTCSASCALPSAASCTPPPEECNGRDDDCDTVPDNGFDCVQGSTVPCVSGCGTTGSGLCGAGCTLPTADDCVPPPEECGNGIDDDCDGLTDEPGPGQCAPGAAVPCTTLCGSTGTGTCTDGCLPPEPDACTPPAETCNAEDDDCDGVTDEDLPCTAGRAVACATLCGSTGTGTCTAACALPDVADCTPPVETCNGLDDDCDGFTDQGFALPPPTPVIGTPHSGAYTGSHLVAGTLRPTFRWQAVSVAGCPAATYDLQVDDSCTPGSIQSCAFPSPELDPTGLTATSYRPAADLAIRMSPPFGRRYYWRVRACLFGRCSAWSLVRYLEVGRVPNDFNGDGSSDVMVGAPTEPDAGSSVTNGRLYVFLGGSPFDTTADLTRYGGGGAAYGEQFGYSIAGAGDVNADGFADFVVGSRGWPSDGTWKGAAYVFYGSAAPDLTPDVFLPGPDDNDEHGRAVAGVGDVDADGFADILVGAQRYNSSQGRAYLYLGGDPMDTAADLVLTGDAPGEHFGWSVAGAGDVNADGYLDLLVGAYAAAGGAGRVALYLGSAAPDGVRDLNVAETSPYALGTSVAGIGDWTGDGIDDVAVGAPDATTTGAWCYRVYAGGPGLDAVADYGASGTSGSRCGETVAHAGDFDADTRDDLWVGVPSLDVPLGDVGEAIADLTGGGALTAGGNAALDRFGAAVGGAGDVDHDGHLDLLVGAPGSSPMAGWVRLFRGDAAHDLAVHSDLTSTSPRAVGFGFSVSSLPP